jgi:hypothetical protein
MKRRTGLLLGLGLISVVSGLTRAETRALSPDELKDIRAGYDSLGTCKIGLQCATYGNTIKQLGQCQHLPHSQKTTTFTTTHRYPLISDYNQYRHVWTVSAGTQCKTSGKKLGNLTTAFFPTSWICRHSSSGEGCSNKTTTCQIKYTVKCSDVMSSKTSKTTRGNLIFKWHCKPVKNGGSPISAKSTCK